MRKTTVVTTKSQSKEWQQKEKNTANISKDLKLTLEWQKSISREKGSVREMISGSQRQTTRGLNIQYLSVGTGFFLTVNYSHGWSQKAHQCPCACWLVNYFSSGSHGASLVIRSLVKCVRKFEHWEGKEKSKKPREEHHVWNSEFKWLIWGGSFRLDTEGCAGGYKWQGFAVQCYCSPGSGAHALAAGCSESRTRHCCSPGISPLRHWCISTASSQPGEPNSTPGTQQMEPAERIAGSSLSKAASCHTQL